MASCDTPYTKMGVTTGHWVFVLVRAGEIAPARYSGGVRRPSLPRTGIQAGVKVPGVPGVNVPSVTVQVKVTPPKGAPEKVDARSERWREHRLKVREEIVDAAFRAIDRLGPNVSVREIAEEAGTAKPKIYRHFADKSDMFSQIGERMRDMLWAAVIPSIDIEHDSTGQIIGRAVEHYVVTGDDLLRILLGNPAGVFNHLHIGIQRSHRPSGADRRRHSAIHTGRPPRAYRPRLGSSCGPLPSA